MKNGEEEAEYHIRIFNASRLDDIGMVGKKCVLALTPIDKNNAMYNNIINESE